MGFVYYGAYSAALIVFAVIVVRRLAGTPHARQLALACVLAYIAGMFHLAHGLYYPIVHGELRNSGAAQLWEVVDASGWSIMAIFETSGGLWGGAFFVLALVGTTFVSVRWPLDDKLRALDACAIALAFALAICKIGCFAVGCCYGAPSDGILAIHNTWGMNATDVARLPTQLFDLAGYATVGLALAAYARRPRARGTLLLWFVVGYAAVRVLTEATRRDGTSPELAGLSLVQIILIAGALVAITFLMRPGWWLRLWSWRSSEPRAADVGPGRSWFLVFAVISTMLFLPTVVFPPVFAAATVVRWRARRSLAEPVAGMALGLLAVTTFFIPSLVPFAVAVTVFAVAVPAAFEHDRARLPPDPG